jgi:hypothetical protein
MMAQPALIITGGNGLASTGCGDPRKVGLFRRKPSHATNATNATQNRAAGQFETFTEQA